jgi:hypothetical protein
MIFSSREKRSFGKRVRNFVWPEIGFKRWAKYLVHRLARLSSTPHVIALGFAAGAFASFTPLVGFHFIIAALVALVLRANVLASAVGTVVGNPLTFPFIWAACYNVGALLLGIDYKSEVDIVLPEGASLDIFAQPILTAQLIWRGIEPIFLPMIIGGVPLGIIGGAICYFAVRAAVQRFQARRKAALARAGTRAMVPGE